MQNHDKMSEKTWCDHHNMTEHSGAKRDETFWFQKQRHHDVRLPLRLENA
jgi:hypothetical protein